MVALFWEVVDPFKGGVKLEEVSLGGGACPRGSSLFLCVAYSPSPCGVAHHHACSALMDHTLSDKFPTKFLLVRLVLSVIREFISTPH